MRYSKQCKTLNVLDNVLGNSPCKTKSIVGTSPPSELINNNQRISRRRFQNGGSFKHFRHECTKTFKLRISCANSSEYTIKNTQCGFTARNKATHLCKKCDNTNLDQRA